MVCFGFFALTAERRDEIRRIPQPASRRDRLSCHTLQTADLSLDLAGLRKNIDGFFAIPSQRSWLLAVRARCIR